jgi:hypothetical protein
MLVLLAVLVAVLAAALVTALSRLSVGRTAQATAAAALDGERRLRDQLESSHRSQLDELERATAEKIGLLSGNREQELTAGEITASAGAEGAEVLPGSLR